MRGHAGLVINKLCCAQHGNAAPSAPKTFDLDEGASGPGSACRGRVGIHDGACRFSPPWMRIQDSQNQILPAAAGRATRVRRRRTRTECSALAFLDVQLSLSWMCSSHFLGCSALASLGASMGESVISQASQTSRRRDVLNFLSLYATVRVLNTWRDADEASRLRDVATSRYPCTPNWFSVTGAPRS